MHIRLQGLSLGISMSTSFSDALVTSMAAAATSSSQGRSHSSGDSLSPIVSSLATNPLAIGGLWMVSSAIFTTYSTTKFIRWNTQVQPSPPLQRKHENLKDLVQWNPVCLYAALSQRLPPASLLTMYRFAGSLLLGIFLHTDIAVMFKRLHSTISAIPAIALPATFLFIANFCNSYVLPCVVFFHVHKIDLTMLAGCLHTNTTTITNSLALDRIGISLTYTSKCAIPLMTVLLTLMLDGFGSLPKPAALLSLLPIAGGIAAASWSSPTFEIVGFVAAAVSAAAQSALNVTSKRAMTRAGLTGPAAQRTMVAVGFMLTVVFNMVQIIRNASTYTIQRKNGRDDARRPVRDPQPLWLTGMAVVAYHIEYVLSFIFVKLVAPITYGTCDSIRRLFIILVGRRMFGGDPLTNTNVAGIALALLGALSYSIVSSS